MHYTYYGMYICTQTEPTWASLEYGVFICVHCSGIFRNMMSYANVKAIRLEDWDDIGVEVYMLIEKWLTMQYLCLW